MAGYVPKSFKPASPSASGSTGYMPKSFKPAPVAAGAPPPPQDDGGALHALERGAGQGATLGFGDEFAGNLDQIVNNLRHTPEALKALVHGDWDTLSRLQAQNVNTYEAGRDEARRTNAAAQDAHPVAYAGGQIAGGLVPAVVLPGGGALQGAVQGLGDSEATDTSGLVEDAAGGAMMGKLGEFGGQLLAKGAGKLGGSLQSMAERRAVKAAGGIQKDVRELLHTDGDVNTLGRYILDNKLLPPLGFGGVEAVADRAGAKAAQEGKTIGSALETLDASAPDAVKLGPIADRVDAEIVRPAASELGMDNVAARARDLSQKLRAMRPGLAADEIGAERPGMSFSEAESRLKRPIDRQVNWNKDQPEPQEALKRARGIISQTIENEAQQADPAAASEFIRAKRSYGKAQDVADIAEAAKARVIGNRVVSPTDYGSAIAGAAMGGAPGAFAMGIANHALRQNLPAVLAQGGDVAGAALGSDATEDFLRALGISGGRNFSAIRDAVRQ